MAQVSRAAPTPQYGLERANCAGGGRKAAPRARRSRTPRAASPRPPPQAIVAARIPRTQPPALAEHTRFLSRFNANVQAAPHLRGPAMGWAWPRPRRYLCALDVSNGRAAQAGWTSCSASRRFGELSQLTGQLAAYIEACTAPPHRRLAGGVGRRGRRARPGCAAESPAPPCAQIRPLVPLIVLGQDRHADRPAAFLELPMLAGPSRSSGPSWWPRPSASPRWSALLLPGRRRRHPRLRRTRSQYVAAVGLSLAHLTGTLKNWRRRC